MTPTQAALWGVLFGVAAGFLIGMAVTAGGVA